MAEFVSGRVRLHYALAGPASGSPIVLGHGFCSDHALNWRGTRWQETLTAASFRVIGLDSRGHGASQKPHDPAAYSCPQMADDVVRLLDHLGLERAHYLGYSMGARIGLAAASRRPERLRRMVLGGLSSWGGNDRAELIARRFRGDTGIRDPEAETYFAFASARPLNDLEALACCVLGEQPPLLEAELGRIRVPALLVAGDGDPIAHDAETIAALMPNARYVELKGRDHMNAVPARAFKDAALAFLTKDSS